MVRLELVVDGYVSLSNNLIWMYILWCFFFYHNNVVIVWLVQFNDILNTIFASAPLVAIIVATILDNTLEPRKAINERGIPWWKPFQHRNGDGRNEEFYSFPLRMDGYLPTRFLWKTTAPWRFSSVCENVRFVQMICSFNWWEKLI